MRGPSQRSPESDSPVHVDDALRANPGQRFDMVLTNPPFGRSSSDSYEREDFWATTRNKQLNFVQHEALSSGLSALEDSCCSRSISVSSGLARVREEAPEPIADGHDSSLFLSLSAEPRWLRAEGCVVLSRVGVWL